MAEIIDLNETKELINLVEQAVAVPYSPSYEFTKRRDERQWERIKKKYNMEDPFEIMYSMGLIFTRDMLDDFYIVYDKFFFKYLTNSENIVDNKEFLEYKNDTDESAGAKIAWMQKILLQLKENINEPDGGLFQGYLLTISLIIEHMHDAIKKEQQI